MKPAAALPDRADAGRRLARALAPRRAGDTVVLALPRGGVPVAAEIARALGAPLDLLFVRKIGAPGNPELAYAAVVDGDAPQVVVNHEVADAIQAPAGWLDDAVRDELAEIERRRQRYLGTREPLAVAGRQVVLVDDGVATGTSVRAAILALRRRGPSSLVLALPVAPVDTLEELRPLVDEIVCLATPTPFRAVGLHYLDFHQLDDDEVVAALSAAARPA